MAPPDNGLGIPDYRDPAHMTLQEACGAVAGRADDSLRMHLDDCAECRVWLARLLEARGRGTETTPTLAKVVRRALSSPE